MTKTILTTALVLTLGQIGIAQTGFDKTKLDNYFNALEQNNKFMGSVAVSKNGEIIYSKTKNLYIPETIGIKISDIYYDSKREICTLNKLIILIF